MDPELRIKQGGRVKAALKAAGIKQSAFAEMQFLKPPYINQILKGDRRLPDDMARKAAEITGVRLEYLLCIDDYMTEEDRINDFLSRHKALSEGYRIFLSWIARRVGATIQYKPAEQDPDTLLTVEDYQPGYYFFTSPSGSGTISETEMARATDEVIEFAEFKLQRLINQNIDAEASGAAGENSERPAVMVQFAGPAPAAQRLRQLKESDLPVNLKDTLEQIILKQQEEANGSGAGKNRTARKEEE